MVINPYIALMVSCFLFAAVHIFEVLAYIARLSGFHNKRTASAYSMYNSVFMITRVFTMAMLPALGYVVDSAIPISDYYYWCSFAAFSAGIASIIVVLQLDVYAAKFSKLSTLKVSGFRLLFEILRAISTVRKESSFQNTAQMNVVASFKSPMLWASVVTHFIYSASVFFMFSVALMFPDYRTGLSHLSGFINAVGAVILTFWIEPNISHSVDSSEDSPDSAVRLLKVVLYGRIFGVTIMTGGAFFILGIVTN